MEDLLTKLGKGDKFTKLDLSQAYHQLELAPECRKYTTINTIKGLYQYTRLPFGIHSAVSIFQRVMDETLSDLPNCGGYLDDVLCTGKTSEEHERNVHQVLSRLQERGFKLRPEKCRYMVDQIMYLGHTISAEGVAPSPEKVRALKSAPPPANVGELQSFIGTATYVGKFIPKFSELMAPLYKLLKKDSKWKWEEAENNAFQKVKDALCENAMLAHYDPSKPLILQVDASSVGLGAVLLQDLGAPGYERFLPVAYASRKLQPAETRYAQIEREALSIVFGVTKFNQYLLGRPFTIMTDHKPLVKVFGKRDTVPMQVSTRLKKWALLLGSYDYELVHIPGKMNFNADFLSRQPMTGVRPTDAEDVTVRVLLVEEDEIVKASVVQSMTAKDPVLSNVLACVKNGWPKEHVSDELAPYFSRRLELATEDDILLWNERVVIPTALRSILLKDLHGEHFGMVRMKQLARRYMWWPGIDGDIESTAKSCVRCQEHAHRPASKAGTWTWPVGPWKRLHIDFAGPFQGKMFLVVVDAYSKYLEVVPMNQATSLTTIAALRHLFSVFGLPEHLVSDNGSQFTSAEFKSFLKDNDILHTLTAPGHPATNGLAERYVGVFKQKMREMGVNGDSLQTRLDRFLLAYRTTPNSTGKSPAELLMNRQPRIRFNALRKSHTSRQVNVFERSMSQAKFNEGDSVFALNFGRGANWLPGKVVHVNSPYSYDVEVGDCIWKRHQDQLRLRTVPSNNGPEPVLSPVNDQLRLNELFPTTHVSDTAACASTITEDEPVCSDSGLSPSVNTPVPTPTQVNAPSSPARPDIAVTSPAKTLPSRGFH